MGVVVGIGDLHPACKKIRAAREKKKKDHTTHGGFVCFGDLVPKPA